MDFIELDVVSAVDDEFMLDVYPRRWLKKYGDISLKAIEKGHIIEYRSQYKKILKKANELVKQKNGRLYDRERA